MFDLSISRVHLTRLFCVCIGLLIPSAIFAQSDPNVADLVSATPVELSASEEQAQRRQAAVQALLQATKVDAETATSPSDSVSEDGVQQAEPTAQDLRRVDESSIAAVPNSARAEAEATRFSALAKRYELGRDLGALRRSLTDFVSHFPVHREARLLLAQVYLKTSQPREALTTLDPVISGGLHDLDWQAWFWAGTAHLSLNEVQAAREHLDVALEKNNRAVAIWVQLAVLEQEFDNHAGALQYLAIAEQLDPNDGAIYLNRGFSLERLGRYPEAVRAYRRFLVEPSSGGTPGVRPAVLRRITLIAAAHDLVSPPS